VRSTHRNAGGASTLLLVALLIGAIGAGAWNYHRNWQREQESRASRPLAGYATEDLEALAEAYRGEVKAGAAKYDHAKQGRAQSRDRAYFDEQVQEFEKVQRASNRTREVGAQLAERETSLRAVEDELAQRGPERSEWARHWDRLTHF
jgi:hypothetical protein